MEGCVFVRDRPAFTGKAKAERKLKLLDTIIDKYYLYEDEVDEDALAEGMYAGYLGGLDDPYSAYFTKRKQRLYLRAFPVSFTEWEPSCHRTYRQGKLSLCKFTKNLRRKKQVCGRAIFSLAGRRTENHRRKSG